MMRNARYANRKRPPARSRQTPPSVRTRKLLEEEGAAAAGYPVRNLRDKEFLQEQDKEILYPSQEVQEVANVP